MGILTYITLFVLISISIFFFVLGVKVLRADPNHYDENMQLTKSLKNAVSGRIETWIDADRRNSRASCGIAVENGKLSPRGKLSDEAVRQIIL